LAVFGLVILGSISTELLRQQLIFLGLGLTGFVILSRVDYRFFTAFPWLLYFLSNLLLVLTFLIGTTTRGSTRWIDVGAFRFQPSELVKLLMIIFLATLLDKKIKSLREFFKIAGIVLVPSLLIFSQPDLGSSIILIGVSVLLMIIGDVNWKFLVSSFIAFALSIPLLWNLIKDYQRERLLTFFGSGGDPLGTGYNAIQAMIAVGSGMFFGRGLGRGTQSQLRFLPERHSDFIFASIGEEFGFLGTSLVVAVYAWLLYSIITVAQHTDDTVGKLICVGVFGLLLVQMFVNIGMNIGLLPITGITLPLISAGGSSLITTLLGLGMVLNIASRSKKTTAVFEIR
jgi:rod shape determining protein RodA